MPQKWKGIPDEDYIRELAARHFSDLTFHELESNQRDDFSDWPIWTTQYL